MTGIEIIAELAQGFEGNPEQAKLLIRAAAKSGANAAKLQMVFADELATPDYEHYEFFKTLEMSNESWSELVSYAKEKRIELQVDIFGPHSLSLSTNLGIKTVKIHGTDIAHLNPLSFAEWAKREVDGLNTETTHFRAVVWQLVVYGIISPPSEMDDGDGSESTRESVRNRRRNALSRTDLPLPAICNGARAGPWHAGGNAAVRISAVA